MLLWSIVAPGPSLDWSAIEPEGVVICINRGLQGASRCDYWCCIDKPNQEHELCVEDARRLRPVVVTMKKQLGRWSAWRKLELRTKEEADHGTSWVQSERKGGSRYSLVSAIAWAVAQGAEEIRFYGVDMTGRGYHTGEPERERAKVGASEAARAKQLVDHEARWSKRWSGPGKELDQVRRVYQAGTRRGIRFVGLPEHVRALPDANPRRTAARQVRPAHADGVGPDRVAGEGAVRGVREAELPGAGRQNPARLRARAAALKAQGRGAGGPRGAETRVPLHGSQTVMETATLLAMAEQLERQAAELKAAAERQLKFAETQAANAAKLRAAAAVAAA